MTNGAAVRTIRSLFQSLTGNGLLWYKNASPAPLRMNKQLYIYDCLTAKLRVARGSFMSIGKGNNNTFRVSMSADNGGSFVQRDETCRFFPHGRVMSYSFNGKRHDSDVVIPASSLCLFVLAGGCFLCWYGDDANRPDFSSLNPKAWYIFKDGAWKAPRSLSDLPIEGRGMPADTPVSFQGMNTARFKLGDILDVVAFRSSQREGDPNHVPLKTNDGRLRCPSCWELFHAGEELAISAHPDLCGDDVLGKEAQQRFRPEKWDAHGVPLDARLLPCSGLACPHCRQKLPPFFSELRQHILSIVGVPASGKSYYLASLIHDLEMEFPREFGMAFRDADPAANATLNDMRTRFFTARTPQEAYIGKTRLDGQLYQSVWRHGHFAPMPRPFIYNLDGEKETYSLVVYDNAGENFEPGRNTEIEPGAEHLHVASAILFLFDPTANPGFRTLLKGHKDPQLRRRLYPAGRQSLMLAEAEMRLRARLNLRPGQKLDVPFAVIIGKCDTWKSLLGPEPLLPLTRNGSFMPSHVEANSARLRQLLFSIAPFICTNAEAISSRVRYFAASPLGKSPVEFTDERSGDTLIGPESGQIQPFRVTDAVLWALNCVEPGMLPGTRN